MSDILPPPPVPATANLQSYPWMPLPVDLILADPWFKKATDAEAWGMIKLMAVAWRQDPAGSLPNDPAYMWDIAGIRDRKGLVKTAIRAQWVLCSDGKLYHPQLSKMVMESMDKKHRRQSKNDRGSVQGKSHITRQNSNNITGTTEEEEPF